MTRGAAQHSRWTFYEAVSLGGKFLSNLIKNWIFSAIIILVWISLGTSGFGADHQGLKADGNTNVMPIRWDQAFLRLISAPDKAKLEQGEIVCGIKK